MVLNDDPEYQWIDKIRAPRASNEARQKLFTKLSGEVQRRIGLKVLDMDANCVLGYQQYFDLEGEYGIVVRGIGTAANIVKQAGTCKSQIYPEITKPCKISPNRLSKKIHSDTDLNLQNLNNKQENQNHVLNHSISEKIVSTPYKVF